MGTTSEFLKLRFSGTPEAGEWNINYKKALSLAKKDGKFIITAWSNGDACDFCVNTEKCMMVDIFKDWMKDVDAYFVFQCSEDDDKGKTLHDWIYSGTGLKQYPGFRLTVYDTKTKKIAFDQVADGNTLCSGKTGSTGAKAMVKSFKAILAKKPAVDPDDGKKKETEDYKVRLNESLTTAQVNKVLDAIDKNDGYCPCQPKGKGTKCHCDDFTKEKKIGEPCICKIYVKQKK